MAQNFQAIPFDTEDQGSMSLVDGLRTESAANLMMPERRALYVPSVKQASFDPGLDPLLKNTGMRFARGFLSFTVFPAISGVEFAEPDVCFAFSEDHTRLVSYDNGIFRVWKVPTFIELCRVESAAENRVISINFLDSNNVSFIAFFNDMSIETYKIEEYLLSAEFMLEKDEYYIEESAGAELRLNPDQKLLSDVDWISTEDDDIIVHCAACADDEILLSFVRGNRRSWTKINPVEYFGTTFKYSHSYFCKRTLLVIGRTEEDGKELPRIGIWSNILDVKDRNTFSVLQGDDGRISADSNYILTWDSCFHGISTYRYVYIYETRSATSFGRGTSRFLSAATYMSAMRSTPKWVYAVPDGALVLHVRLSVQRGGDSANVNRLLDSGTKLILLCDVSWSQKAKIFVVDVPNKTVDFQFETQFSFKEDIETPFNLMRQLYLHRPFIVSPDHNWLFLTDPGTRRGFIFATRNEHPIFTLDWSHDQLFVPTHLKFSRNGRYISLDNGFRHMHFSFGSSWRGYETSSMRHLLSDQALFAISFWRMYDRIALDKFISQGFALKNDPRKIMENLVSKDIFGAIQRRIESFEKKSVLQAIFSQDMTAVAFVIDREPIRIEIWKTESLSDDASAISDDRVVIPVPGAKVDLSIGRVIGMFYFGRTGVYTFATLLPHSDGVSIVKVRFIEPKERTTIHVIRPRGGGAVLTMKTSEDGRRGLVVFQSGRFAVVNFDKGFISETTGRLRYPCEIETFVRTFIDSTFIHISEDSKSFVAGWIPYRRRVARFALSGSDRRMYDDFERNNAMLSMHGMEHVLWINDEHTRVAVHSRSSGPFALVFYDISEKTGKELVRIPGSIPNLTLANLPKKDLAWIDTFDESRPGDLRALCVLAVLFLTELPADYKLLSLLGIYLNPEITERLLEKFGENAVNAEKPEGKSVLHLAIHQNRLKSAALLFDYAKEHGIPVNLTWGRQNILKWAIDQEMYDTVNFILERLADKCTNATSAAHLLREHFIVLLEKCPKVLERFIRNDSFCFELGRFTVPASIFRDRGHGPVAMSCEYVPPWNATGSEEIREFWIQNNARLAPVLKDSTGVQITAVSKFICIEHCLHRQPSSVLKEMIAVGYPSDVFKTDTVRVLVEWIWYKYLRRPFVVAIIFQLLAAAFFAFYASNFGGSTSESELPASTVYAMFAILISLLFQLLLLTEKTGRWIRFAFVITTFALFIQLIVSENRHNAASATVASIECIYLTISVLWYLQPFAATGSLTAMIRYMVQDVRQFLLLSAVIIVGFGLAMHVLFLEEVIRSTGSTEDETSLCLASNGTVYWSQKNCTELYENRGHAHLVLTSSSSSGLDTVGYSATLRSFMTMFFAMIGNFDPTLYREESPSFISVWRSFLFCVFLFFGGIVLLSLLVAILSDTYDKVKMTEQGEAIKSRARIVGVWDGWFNIVGRGMRKEKKYFHFLVADEALNQETSSWEGRITEVVKLFKREIDENDMITVKAAEEVQERVSALKDEMENMRMHVSRVEDTLTGILHKLNN